MLYVGTTGDKPPRDPPKDPPKEEEET